MLQARYLRMMRHGGYGRPPSVLDLSYGSALLPSLPFCSKISLFHCYYCCPTTLSSTLPPLPTYLYTFSYPSLFTPFTPAPYQSFPRLFSFRFPRFLGHPISISQQQQILSETACSLGAKTERVLGKGKNCGSIRRNRLAGKKTQRC